MVELGSREFWSRLEEAPARLAAEVCLVDVANLDQTLQTHAALHAWINAAHEAARIDEERGKWELTKSRARKMLAAKGNLDEQTGKAKTVGVLDAEVELDAEVQLAQSLLFKAQEKRGILRAMADALDDRKDMLVQIAAKQREERKDYR